MLKLCISDVSAGVIVRTMEASSEDLELGEFPEFEFPINAKFTMNRVGDDIFIRADISTSCRFQCDRCLESFNATVEDSVRMIFTPSATFKSERDDYVYIVAAGANEIDVTVPVKETLILALPSKKLCKDDCLGLCPTCGQNLNEGSCNCERKKIDPRWEVLRHLKE